MINWGISREMSSEATWEDEASVDAFVEAGLTKDEWGSEKIISH